MNEAKTRNYELTHAQKRVFYSQAMHENTCLSNIGGYIRFDDLRLNQIKISNLKAAIIRVINKYDTLRTKVEISKDIIRQCFRNDEHVQIPVKLFKNISEFETWTEHSITHDISFLDSKKLFRFCIYEISDNCIGIIFFASHLIVDGWSMNLILKDTIKFYNEFLEGNNYLDSTASYQDYITLEQKFLNGDKYEQYETFWLNKFQGVDDECLYNATQATKGMRKVKEIPTSLKESVSSLIKNKKISLNCFMMLVVAIYEYKISYKKDITLGTVLHNRINAQLKLTAGMMTSTMPFRIIIDEYEPIKLFLKRFKNEFNECLRFQQFPYDLLVKKLKLNKLGYDNLFKKSINSFSLNQSLAMHEIKGYVCEIYSGEQSYSQQIQISEKPGGNWIIIVDYKISEYEDFEIDIMMSNLLTIMNTIMANENICMYEIKLLNDKEIENRNSNFQSYCNSITLNTFTKIFSKYAINNPNMTAVVYEDSSYSYSEINSVANKISAYIRNSGCRKGEIIAVAFNHSPGLITSIIGILKCGLPFLPIDINLPIERISYMLKDSKCSLMLTNCSKMLKYFNEAIHYSTVICAGDDLAFTDNSELHDLAYVIYTSGSTGEPKGVMVGNNNLMSYLNWAKEEYNVNQLSSMPLFTSISFDLTITSLFLPLLSGGKILIYYSKDDEFILDTILMKNEATIIKLTPAHMSLLQDRRSNNSIATIIVGGDNLKTDLAGRVYLEFNKRIDIFNEYGPTETTVGCMIHKYDYAQDRRLFVPIGRPIKNTQIYLFDEKYNEVPNGQIGEIFVSGEGVSRGYLNNPELTDERFILNPYECKKVMYKTGDQARFLNNFTMEFVGRKDNQIKVRGFRIEIGEIERWILSHKNVVDVTVVNLEYRNSTNLAAFVVSKEQELIDFDQLEKYLGRYLPHYMIPRYYKSLDKIPLTSNGKIDLNQLRLSEEDKRIISFQDKLTDIEVLILGVIKEVLGLEDIAISDSFYHVGGDSISAIQVLSKLNQYGVKLSIDKILKSENIQEIADNAVYRNKMQERIKKISTGMLYSTPIFKWFLDQKMLYPKSYCQFVNIELETSIEINIINQAVNFLIKTNDALRINFDSSCKTFYYNNSILDEKYHINYIKIDNNFELTNEYVEAYLSDRIKDFSLDSGLLFDVSVLQNEQNAQTILFLAHHIIIDGVSWRVLINNFFRLCQKKEIIYELASYQEWAEEHKLYLEQDFSDEMEYWHRAEEHSLIKLTGVSKYNKHVLNIGEEFIGSCTMCMKTAYNIGLEETLLIALVWSYYKWSNIVNIVINLERHGRDTIPNIDVGQTIGWFTRIFPVYFRVEDNSLAELIMSLKEQLRAVPSEGKHYGIIKYLKGKLKDERTHNITFNYLGEFKKSTFSSEQIDVKDINVGMIGKQENLSHSFIELNAIKKNGSLSVLFESVYLGETDLSRFSEIYLECLKKMNMEATISHERYISPSDFEMIAVSKEEFYTLFE